MSDPNEESKMSKSSDSGSKKFREDFEFLKEIGEGSFSTVYLAKEKKSGMLFAIKECDKSQIIKEKKVKYVHLEKKILAELLNNNPFFVQLCFTFQDSDSLYFGLTYCPNGDLLTLIKKHVKFSLDMSKFYAAELVEALQFMHGKQIVHRDLKPENVLLDDKLHIKLTDFGTSRILGEPEQTEPPNKTTDSSNEEKGGRYTRRRNSFVGTAQFVAPEILQGKDPHIGSDLWALGCITFQMLSGKHLFTGSHEYDIFQKIIRLEYTFPDEFPQSIRDLISNLILSEPTERLGANESQSRGYMQLKAHEFFNSIDWNKLNEQTPPSN